MQRALRRSPGAAAVGGGRDPPALASPSSTRRIPLPPPPRRHRRQRAASAFAAASTASAPQAKRQRAPAASAPPPASFSRADLVPLGASSGLLVSPLGLGTWAWGNRLLWGYEAGRDDPRLRAAFARAAAAGVNLWDTGDSYGTSLPGAGGQGTSGAAVGVRDGRAEALLGEFDREVQAAAAAEAGRGGGGGGRDGGGGGGLLGRFLRGLGGGGAKAARSSPARAIVATKLAAYPWRVTPESTVAAARASRRRVAGLPPAAPRGRGDSGGGGTDDDDDAPLPPLGVAQAHWSTANYQPFQERAQLEGLARAYEQGVASSVGLSNYGPKELARAADFFERRIGAPPAVAQVQWSLLSDTPEQRDVAALCRARGIAMIGYSPLALGALSGRYDGGGGRAGGGRAGGDGDNADAPRPLPPGLRGYLLADILRKAAPVLACVRAVAEERGRTPAQVAIAWVSARGAIPIPGAKTAAMVDEAVGAVAGWRLGAGEMDELAEAQRRCGAGRLMPRNVFQTK